MCWSCCASPPQRSARRLVRLMSWHLVANESRAMDGDLYGSIFISIYGGTTTPGPFLPRRAYRLPGSHSNPAPYRPTENGEPQRGREKHARGVLGFPGWHKTRGLPPEICDPLTPGNSTVGFRHFPGGFVSPLRVALSARVSTHDQHTRAMQIDAMRTCATRRGWTVTGCHRGMGSNATENRPKRQELLNAARQRQLEVMLVWKRDRWGALTASMRRGERASTRNPCFPAVAARQRCTPCAVSCTAPPPCGIVTTWKVMSQISDALKHFSCEIKYL